MAASTVAYSYSFSADIGINGAECRQAKKKLEHSGKH
jgi:hypothetical protein